MVIAALSFLTTGLAFLGGSYYTWQDNEKIRSTPKSTVRSISIGRTELHGTINSEQSITAPISQKPCVAYHILVSGGKTRNGMPAGATTKQDSVPTTLEDSTGRIRVDLDDVDIKTGHKTYHQFGRNVGDVNDSVQNRLNKAGIDVTLTDGKAGSTVEERRIDHEDTVYLLGTARDNPDVKDTTAQHNQDDLLITKGNNPFMISNSSEEDLKQTLSKKTLITLTLGLLLTIAGTVFLVTPL